MLVSLNKNQEYVLKIITDTGYTLDLREDIAIPVKLKNSFFSNGIVEGDVAYSFTLPDTDNNKQALGFMHMLESTTPFSNKINVTIHFGGGEFARAVMTIGRNLTARLALAKSFLLNTIENTKLADLDLSDVDFETRAHLELPVIINEGFFTDERVFDGIINSGDLGLPSWRWSPQLHLKKVVQQIAKKAGFTLSGDLFDNAEIATLLLYNNTLSKLFTFTADNRLITSTLEFEHETGDDNAVKLQRAQLIIRRVDTGQESIAYSNTMQQVRDFDQPIRFDGFQKNELGLSYSNTPGRFSGFPVAQYDIELRTELKNELDDIVNYSIEYDIDSNPITLFAEKLLNLKTYSDFDFNPNIHLPEATCKELLNAVLLAFCAKMDVDGPHLEIKSRKSILESGKYLDITQYAGKNELPENDYKGYTLSYKHDNCSLKSARLKSLADFEKVNVLAPVAALTDLDALTPALNDVRLVTDINQFYIYAVKEEQDNDVFSEREWKLFSDNLLSYKVDTGEETITAPFSILLQSPRPVIHNTPGDVIVPEINQPGNAPYLNITGNPCGINFLFYRGNKFASYDTYDASGASVGNYSLRWDGDKGLYNVWWKRYAQFRMNAKNVEGTPLWLPWSIINNYASQLFSQKLRIGNMYYMMEELSFTLRLHTITDQQATLYTV